MSRSPSWSRATNAETIILLAFFSTLDLPRLLHERKQRQSWKMAHELLHDLLEEQLSLALTCFHDFPVYGPAFQRLVQHRVDLVDLQSVDWAVSLEDLVDPSNGLYFSDDPYLSGKQREVATTISETELFWQVLTEHEPLIDRLRRLDDKGLGRVCQYAQRMRAFLSQYATAVARHLISPLFVPQFLLLSVQRIDWHAIAERLSGGKILLPCHCASIVSQEADPGVQTLLFEEVLQLAQAEIVQAAQRQADPQEALARVFCVPPPFFL